MLGCTDLLGTVIFLAESLLKLKMDVMRLVTVSVLAEPLGIEHTALSFSVEETVGDKARSSLTSQNLSFEQDHLLGLSRTSSPKNPWRPPWCSRMRTA